MRNQRKFTVVIEPDEDGYYIGTVPTLPGCHTQARTLDTLSKRMRGAVELCPESDGGAFPQVILQMAESRRCDFPQRIFFPRAGQTRPRS